MSDEESTPDVSIARFDELEAFHHGAFRRLRAGLGGRAFGIQIVTLPPHSDVYPEHHHTELGQEEIYVAISGRARMQVAGSEHVLEPGVFFRIGPEVLRKVTTGEDPVQFVVVGGVPGEAFRPQPYTELGGPVAVVTAEPSTAAVGEPVTFDGSASRAAEAGDNLAYSWDPEGSGSPVDGGPTFVHRFGTTGSYRATLRIKTRSGRWDVASVTVTVM